MNFSCFLLLAANGCGKLAWDAVEGDDEFINFIHHRHTASNQNCMPKPDFQRDLTSAHVYLLHKTTKNRASIQGVARLLDPELRKLSDSALKSRLARTVTRFEKSMRDLQRCTDTQRETFFGRHVSHGIPDKPKVLKATKKSKTKKKSGGALFVMTWLYLYEIVRIHTCMNIYTCVCNICVKTIGPIRVYATFVSKLSILYVCMQYSPWVKGTHPYVLYLVVSI